MSTALPSLPAEGAIVISRPDRVGDAIIASACFSAIQDRFPGRPIYYLARPVMAPLFEGHPLLAGFLPRTESAPDLIQQLKEIRASIFVHLHPDPLCYRAAAAAGVETRIGYGHWLGWTLTHSQPDDRSAGLQHESDYNFELLGVLGVENPGDARPSVHLPPSARDSLRQILAVAGLETGEPYAVINPTAHSATLRWQPERFAALAQRLHEAFGWRVVLTCGGDSDPSVERMRESLTDASYIIDLSGRTNLAETGWLLQGARLLVGRDTGTSHLAAAVDCPSVTIFGRLESTYGPTRWRALFALGRGRIVETPVVERQRFEGSQAFWARGFDAITVDHVFTAAAELATVQAA